jgi:hypothetical protein
MNSPVICQPTLRLNSDASPRAAGRVTACCLDPDLVAFLSRCARPDDLLKSVFRVKVAQGPSPRWETVPAVAGRYFLFEDEVQFIPHLPFERNVKYCATFDLRPLGALFAAEPLSLEFVIPSEQKAPTLTVVTHIFPSGDSLPENLLRFYVGFSNSMQRGRALQEISLLDSDGQPVADALYRAPVELWDKTMRHLTVLLDPGRLKRWVGPNIALGPPLKVGQAYTLQIGSGMIDLCGRPLRESFRKRFVVSDAVREAISPEHWKILPPATGGRQPLALRFKNPLDWGLLLRTITVESADGLRIDGQVLVDQCESRWSLTPNSPWTAGVYRIRVASGLEDVCGNTMTGAFDRPLRKDANLEATTNNSLTFQLT